MAKRDTTPEIGGGGARDKGSRGDSEQPFSIQFAGISEDTAKELTAHLTPDQGQL